MPKMISDMIDTPLYEAIVHTIIFTPHRWMPKDAKAKMRKPNAEGNTSELALIYLDLIAPIIVKEFSGPDGYEIPEDPVDRSCFIAAALYLEMAGGNPILDTRKADAWGLQLMLATGKAQHLAASVRGAAGGAHGAGSDELNGLIKDVIAENPSAAVPKLSSKLTARLREKIKAEKAVEERKALEALLLHVQSNRDAIRQRIERLTGARK